MGRCTVTPQAVHGNIAVLSKGTVRTLNDTTQVSVSEVMGDADEATVVFGVYWSAISSGSSTGGSILFCDVAGSAKYTSPVTMFPTSDLRRGSLDAFQFKKAADGSVTICEAGKDAPLAAGVWQVQFIGFSARYPQYIALGSG